MTTIDRAAIALSIAIVAIAIGFAAFMPTFEPAQIEKQPTINSSPQIEKQYLTQEQKTIDLVDKAIDIYSKIGSESFELITNDSTYKIGEQYVFVLDSQGFRVAHGGNPDLIGLQAPNFPENPLRDLILNAATSDGEWVTYTRALPQTHDVQTKNSYVKTFDGYIFGSGYYSHDTTQDRKKQAQALVEQAIGEYHKKGADIAFDDFNDSGTYHDGELYVFVLTADTAEIVAHGAAKDMIGKSGFDVIDRNGLNIGELFTTKVTDQGVWVTYDWLNPTTQEVEPKLSWLKSYDNLIFGVGVYEDAPSKTAKVAVLFPTQGDFATHGSENLIAAKLAVKDFNEKLETLPEIDWKMEIKDVYQDDHPDGIEKIIKELHLEGYDYFIGPETSSQVSLAQKYASRNNIVLISPSSTAPSLAIEDNIFRLVPDDGNQAKALSAILDDDGISSIVMLTRDDTWGNDLRLTMKTIFGNQDSDASIQSIMYDPKNPQYSENTAKLSEMIGEAQMIHSSDEIAVILIGFGESTDFLKEAANYDYLDEVRWYGTDSNANEYKITSDKKSLDFATKVDFTAVQFGISDNPIKNKVTKHIFEITRELPSSYAYSSYDAVMLLGESLMVSDREDPFQIMRAIDDVAKSYEGALGNIELNQAGDLKSGDYDIWKIKDGKWYISGKFVTTENKIQ